MTFTLSVYISCDNEAHSRWVAEEVEETIAKCNAELQEWEVEDNDV